MFIKGLYREPSYICPDSRKGAYAPIELSGQEGKAYTPIAVKGFEYIIKKQNCTHFLAEIGGELKEDPIFKRNECSFVS